MHRIIASGLLIVGSLIAAQLGAQETRDIASEDTGAAPVALQMLLERVESRPARRFLIDMHARREIYVGGTPPAEITYPVLLGILRANGLAAVEIEGLVNIVPVQQIRSYPVPMVDPSDRDIPDDEWVSTVVHLSSMNAAQAIPVLRPLMPMEAHFAAMPPSTIVIVDRFANLRRIVAMVRELDQAPATN